MLSQTAEYALRAVVYLAYEAPEARTTEQIHQATLVKRAYLAKILQGLAKKGIVTTQRGVGGGVALAKSPQELTLLEVVNAVEPLQRIRTCPLGIATHGSRLCPLHRRIDAVLAVVEEQFARTTLAEILSEPGANMPLCETPRPVKLQLLKRPT
ncbi:MAG: Rrf2 family transcriptional regulator [Thermogemmata sp.]|jgi:Rrf2 family protein|uniref:Rrf2 family transcriptional regulator n=1 Tax=Thermogemmata fonticola TaxID=2755323 RepID=A0A7V9ACV0_9BACT|nr:Rrf2 family transcriptional regulator [Thermogemmata fonticola]MBA2227137.1 Rrf2 family transcriptional regulator [Thermogemmata fonticola]MCX8138435.1 Rrf2 family transcriptional regulator [Gemmataceae bacterium]